MFDLSFVVLTANRSQLLAEYLDSSIQSLLVMYNFALYIIDGSGDDSSFKIVNQMNQQNVFYFHKKDMTFSERVIFGYNTADSLYVCVTGDTKLIVRENIDLLNKLMKKGYDIITMSYRDKKNLKYKEYRSIVDYFKDNAWDTTLFGTVFIKKASYTYINPFEFRDLYGENPFPQVIIYFNYLLNYNNFEGCYIGKPIITISKNAISSWPDKIYVFGKQLIECIEYLNPIYNEYKENVILDHGKYSSLEWGETVGFHKLRMLKKLDIETYDKYKDLLPKLTKVDLNKIYAISKEPFFVSKVFVTYGKVLRKIKHVKWMCIDENKKFFH